MILLSIDASTKSSGIAIFNQGKLIHYECISEISDDKYVRINNMINRIKELCIQYKPTDIIMQDILPQDVKHNQSVFKALIYLQAGIVLQLSKIGLEVNLYTASHWRAQIGIRQGAGIKRQELKKASQKLVKNIYNLDVNDDISDAICIGIAYIKEKKGKY